MTNPEQKTKLKELIKKESTNLQWPKLILNFTMMIVLVIIQILRGKGDGSMAGIKKCSAVDWFLFFLLIFIGLVLTIIAIIIINNEYKQKVSAGYHFIAGDVKCTLKLVSKLCFISFTAGLLNGSLGIGTGLILNPILI